MAGPETERPVQAMQLAGAVALVLRNVADDVGLLMGEGSVSVSADPPNTVFAYPLFIEPGGTNLHFAAPLDTDDVETGARASVSTFAKAISSQLTPEPDCMKPPKPARFSAFTSPWAVVRAA